LNQEAFREACAHWTTGITIATVIGADGEPYGLTASSFTPVSLRPPLVLVSIDHKATLHHHFASAFCFAVNILAEDQRDLSARFARHAQHRFHHVAWSVGELGAPLLDGVLAWLECRVTQRVDAGDHTLLLGEVRHTAAREGRPLVYFYRDYRKIAL
jgi:flavin reductase (DIM6/NTAB) family NADH-FMN oxidoreductase RutF